MQQQRESTSRSPSVFVVEASAGSGKTRTLAQRYLCLLLETPAPSRLQPLRAILAVTFTNMAAYEMKRRILDALKKIALDDFQDGEEKRELMGPLNLDAQTARKRAGEAVDAILRNYHFFQVRTIDSFVHTLLSGCAFRLSLSSAFRVRSDSDAFLSESLDRVLHMAAGEPGIRSMLEEILYSYLVVEGRGGWRPRADLLALLRELFDCWTTRSGSFEESEFSARTVGRLREAVRDSLVRLRGMLPVGTNGTFLKSLDRRFSDAAWPSRIEELPTALRRTSVPMNNGYALPEEVASQWSECRRLIREWVEAETFSTFDPYIRFLGIFLQDLRTLAVGKDMIFLKELNRRAGILFSEEGLPVEEVYLRLALRFSHYLLDEFQDTNRIQWNNISPMIEEALASGGTLFYVGDRKQAIYRFRGGDPELFDAVAETLGLRFGTDRRVLGSNRRSSRRIVEFVNEVFSEANLREFLEEFTKERPGDISLTRDEMAAILDNFRGSTQTCIRKEEGYVRVEMLTTDSGADTDADIQERESSDETGDRGDFERLTGLVQDLLQRLPPEAIAVLTRTNREVEGITARFLECGIPVESEKTLNIRQDNVVRQLLSFLTFLNSPVDNVAFSCFILGDVFVSASGIPVSDLHRFLLGNRLCLRGHCPFYLYPEFRKAFPKAWARLVEPFFDSVGFLPLYELVTGIVQTLRILEHFPDRQAFLMRLLELIRRQEEERPGIPFFLEYIRTAPAEELYVDVGDVSAVKVRTIHSAKGLEFPVVVLPSFGMDLSLPSRWRGPVVEQGPEGKISLLRLKKDNALWSETVARVWRKEFAETIVSELNTAYVALTRAKEELYILLAARSGRGRNPAVRLIREAESGRRTLRLPVAVENPVWLGISGYEDWLSLLKDEFLTREDLLLRRQRIRGAVIHEFLARVGNLHGRDVRSQLEAAAEYLRARGRSPEDVETAGKVVEGLIARADCRPFFFTEGARVYTEREIVDRQGRVYRVDRLIVFPDRVWVVEYKSSADPERQRSQVREYMESVRDVFPGSSVSGYILYQDVPRTEAVDG